jgi:hypothetical protein
MTSSDSSSSIPDGSDNGSKKRKHGSSSAEANPIDDCVNLIDTADKISHSAKVVLEALTRIEKKHGSLSEDESGPLKKVALAMEKAALAVRTSAATLSPTGHDTLYVQSRLAKTQKVARAQSREPGKTTSESLQTIEEFVEDVVADVETPSKAENVRATRSKTSKQESPLIQPANGVKFGCAEAMHILLETKNMVMPLIAKWIENKWIPCQESACYNILQKLKEKEVDISNVRWPRQNTQQPAAQKHAPTKRRKSLEDTALLLTEPRNGVEFECAEAMNILLRAKNVVSPLLAKWIENKWISCKAKSCHNILKKLREKEVDISNVRWPRPYIPVQQQPATQKRAGTEIEDTALLLIQPRNGVEFECTEAMNILLEAENVMMPLLTKWIENKWIPCNEKSCYRILKKLKNKEVDISNVRWPYNQKRVRAEKARSRDDTALLLIHPRNGVEFECAEAMNILLGAKNVVRPLLTKWVENKWTPCKESACYAILKKLKEKEVDISNLRWPRSFIQPPASQIHARTEKPRSPEDTALLLIEPRNGVEFECAEAMNILLETRHVVRPLLTKWIENKWIPCKDNACYRILKKLKDKEVDISNVRWPRSYIQPPASAQTEKPRSPEDTALLLIEPANGVEFECAEAMNILLETKNVVMPLIAKWIENKWIPCQESACYNILQKLKKKEVDISNVRWPRPYTQQPATQKRSQTENPSTPEDTALLLIQPANGVEFECAEAMHILLEAKNVVMPLLTKWSKNKWIPCKEIACYRILKILKKKEVDVSNVRWPRP